MTQPEPELPMAALPTPDSNSADVACLPCGDNATFPINSEDDWALYFRHYRDEHPDQWDSNPEIQREARTWGVV